MTDADARQEVLRIIAQVSGVDPHTLEDDTMLVAHLGIDSPRALQMLVDLEDRLGIEIDDDEVAALRTVGDVLRCIARHRVETAGE